MSIEQDHYSRVMFIKRHLLLPYNELSHRFQMEFGVSSALFKRYVKVATTAREAEIEALKADDSNFNQLFKNCQKRQAIQSRAFTTAKALFKDYLKLSQQYQTKVDPGALTPAEKEAIKTAVALVRRPFGDI